MSRGSNPAPSNVCSRGAATLLHLCVTCVGCELTPKLSHTLASREGRGPSLGPRGGRRSCVEQLRACAEWSVVSGGWLQRLERCRAAEICLRDMLRQDAGAQVCYPPRKLVLSDQP